MASQTGHDTAATLSPAPDVGAATARDRYLVVFEESSSLVYPLPARGEVVIGRGSSADLKLQDASASRRHACLRCEESSVEIADLESQHGTIVDGEQLAGPRRLANGDSISICSAVLVFHAPGPAPLHRPLLDLEPFCARLDEEIERAVHYRRSFVLLVAQLGTGALRDMAAGAWLKGLRPLDVAGGRGGELLAILPELGLDAAAEAAAQALAALLRVDASARVGYATCPTDGCDRETVLAAARAAAAAAAPATALGAGHAFHTRTVGGHTIVIADPAMQALYVLLDRLARADLPVLVTGETGTGKELAASVLHHGSGRRGRLLTLNCAALPETLVESELFGHEKGAFTGADTARIGLFESANGGTVFLDEIGDMPQATQAKLLRVLEVKRIVRLGDVRERAVDVRVIAATNRDLAEEVKAGRFRQDLYFRLSAATVWIPPLRDRRRELPILAQHFLAEACARTGRTLIISEESMRRLASQRWQGNVRQLKNMMEYAAAAVAGPVLESWHLDGLLDGALPAEPEPPPPVRGGAPFRPIEDELRELERTRMAQALQRCDGNQTHAAALIGMPLRTFQAKLRHYDLPRPGRK